MEICEVYPQSNSLSDSRTLLIRLANRGQKHNSNQVIGRVFMGVTLDLSHRSWLVGYSPYDKNWT